MDFTSNMGGVCGLCLEISFVSIIEFIYWVSVRLLQTHLLSYFYPASALRALGLLLADGALTVGRGETF